MKLNLTKEDFIQVSPYYITTKHYIIHRSMIDEVKFPRAKKTNSEKLQAAYYSNQTVAWSSSSKDVEPRDTSEVERIIQMDLITAEISHIIFEAEDDDDYSRILFTPDLCKQEMVKDDYVKNIIRPLVNEGAKLYLRDSMVVLKKSDGLVVAAIMSRTPPTDQALKEYYYSIPLKKINTV